MADNEKNGALEARKAQMNGQNKKLGPIPLAFGGILLFAVILIIVAPNVVGSLFGLGTSESEKLQTASIADSGISTTLVPESGKKQDAGITTALRPEDKAKEEPVDDESARKIAELEAQLKELRERPVPEGGLSQEQMQAALAKQAEILKKQSDEQFNNFSKLYDAKLSALEARKSVEGDPDADARQRLEEERRRRLEELARRKAEREAELNARLKSDANIFDESKEGETSGGNADDKPEGVKDHYSANEEFLRRNRNLTVDVSYSTDIADVSATIVQGTIITAALETALNSELPGTIRASVVNPVYSFDGEEVLIPAGSRLVGTYSDMTSIAQKRALIAWNRVITPEGKSAIMSASGADYLGRAGVEGNVDNRFGVKLGAALAITTMAGIPAYITAAINKDSNGGNSNNNGNSSAGDLGVEASNALGEQTEEALQEYLELKPIIRIPQGTVVKVMVNQDIIFQ